MLWVWEYSWDTQSLGHKKALLMRAFDGSSIGGAREALGVRRGLLVLGL